MVVFRILFSRLIRMAVFIRKSDPMISCPYNEAHRLLKSRLQMHLVKCKKDNITVQKKTCPFNAQHLVDPERFQSHLSVCPERCIVDRQITVKEQTENTPHGCISVPAYRSLDTPMNYWELNDKPVAGYEPEKHLDNKTYLIRDQSHQKPSVKKKYYKDTFNENASAAPEVKPEPKVTTTVFKISEAPRRPKQDAKILQELEEAKNNAAFSRSKLAAKFSKSSANTNNNNNSSDQMSLLLSGVTGIGIGRGRSLPK